VKKRKTARKGGKQGPNITSPRKRDPFSLGGGKKGGGPRQGGKWKASIEILSALVAEPFFSTLVWGKGGERKKKKIG